MPTWNGWNEQEVRQAQSSLDSAHPVQDSTAHFTTMARFTAINVARPGLRAKSITQAGQVQRNTAQPSNANGQHEHRGSVASEYLGRDFPDESSGPVEETTGTLHGPGTKEAAGKGQERAENSNDSQRNPKRRKTSNVSDSMSITKPGARIDQSSIQNGSIQNESLQATDIHTEAPPAPGNKTSKTKGSLKPPSINVSANNSTSSVSLFAQSTSMDSLQATSQPTSLDAVRASSGHGTTLYRSAQNSSKQTDTKSAQQLLNQQTRPNDGKGSVANTRVLRPRKANGVQPPEPWPTEQVEGTKMANTVVRRSTQDKSQSKIEDRTPTSFEGKTSDGRSCSRRNSSHTLSDGYDDFMMSDDDITEALEIAETLEASRKPKRKTGQSSRHKGQLPTPGNSEAPSGTQTEAQYNRMQSAKEPLVSEDGYMELHEENEVDLSDLPKATKETISQRPPTPPPRFRKLNIHEVDADENHGVALLTDAEKQLLDQLKASKKHTIKPIVREPFPTPILDRSSLFGVSNTTVLRTCFRVGEALNVGSQAVRTNKGAVLELYARVTSSWREGRKQHFVFKDLYHDNPPHLEGSFELCDQSRLWDLDSKAFLRQRDGGVMCRVIAKMKREGMKWRLEVLSIWEAGWEDVEFVAGIYAREMRSEDVNEG